MTSKTQEMYRAEYERLEQTRYDLYDEYTPGTDLVTVPVEVLREHGRLLKRLMIRTASLGYDVQTSQEHIAVLEADLKRSRAFVDLLEENVRLLERR